MATKWTASDVPDQAGRVAVITGSNTGIGYEAAAVLAGKGAHVVLAVRNLDKGRDAVARIMAITPEARVSLQPLDLTSLEDIREASDALKAAHPRIDLLVNNAGVMQTPKGTTKDGFELQLGTNHLGHFALTGLLFDALLRAEGSRVVTISSQGHRLLAKIDFDDLQSERHYNRVAAYGQSKLANLLFTYELARRLDGTNTIAVAAHPGGADTQLNRNWPAWFRPAAQLIWGLISQPAAMGALPTLRAATDPGVHNAQYYGPDGIGEQHGHPKLVESNKKSHDRALQRRLWAVSEELTGVTYPV
jgi:NAD(P)-dependent dehydrogenase (short-subunit alcohol dehydrogenase family)